MPENVFPPSHSSVEPTVDFKHQGCHRIMLVTHFPTFVPDISSSILDRRSRLLLVDTVVNSTAEISDEDLLSDEEQGLRTVPHRLDQRAIFGTFLATSSGTRSLETTPLVQRPFRDSSLLPVHLRQLTSHHSPTPRVSLMSAHLFSVKQRR